jgi:CBS domain-containing protein
MKAIDVMVSPVITVGPDASVVEVAEILLKNRISAVPVVDQAGTLVGIVSEGDLMRRAEVGTDRRRSWWLELIAGYETIVADYVKSHAHKVSDVMTTWPVTVTEATPLAEIADLLEGRRIKRVPVMREGKVVGIVSRANLLQAFASMYRQAAPADRPDDHAIRIEVLKTIDDAHLTRPYGLDVKVKDGNVDLWGVVGTADEKKALRIAAEVTQGVQSVADNLIIKPRIAVSNI